MMAANQPKLKKNHLVCTMKPLRQCIDKHRGDLSQCKEEIKLFESTCDKRLQYIHDRDGLDDSRTGLYSGVKPQ